MSDEKGCNISISSLIPYGNLDGDGFVISGFLEKHWEYGTFGTILPIAVKAMTLTEKESNFKSPNPLYFETPTTGRLALSLFIDNAIKKENAVCTRPS